MEYNYNLGNASNNISFDDYASFDKKEGYKKSTIVPENIAFKIQEDVYSNVKKNKNEYTIGKTGRRNKIVPAEKRCSATCLTGEQCSKASLIESEYCRLHDKKLNPETYRRKPVNIERDNVKHYNNHNDDLWKDTIATDKCISNCSVMGGRKRTKRHTKKCSRRTRRR